MTTVQPGVLILCTGNSARSQMAEAILRHLSGGEWRVESAGTAPQPEIHPMARIAVKSLLNLDMAGQFPKMLDRFAGERFSHVITVCDRAAETCPVFPGETERIHWSLEDPAAVTGSAEERQRAFDATARDLLHRFQQWSALPGSPSKTPGD
jgi:protein-tyrosine-phosphatase